MVSVFFFLPTLVPVAVEGVFSNLLALAAAVPIGSGWLPPLSTMTYREVIPMMRNGKGRGFSNGFTTCY